MEYPRRAVVDSGPLFTVLTINYLTVARVVTERRRSILKEVTRDRDLQEDADHQKAYLAFFHHIRWCLTSSHVIGELQGLRNSRLRLGAREREAFWSSSIDFLRGRNLDEHLVTLLSLAGSRDGCAAISRIGSTDAGLIDLARRQSCVLYTDDERTLRPMALELGVDCRLVRPIVP